jgi:hypothetical protein
VTTNEHLFKPKPVKSGYKKNDLTTIATTIGTIDEVGHQAVVLVKQEGGEYTPALFDIHPSRSEALQRAHYINANYILRGNVDPVPMHLIADDDTAAGLRAKGYVL